MTVLTSTGNVTLTSATNWSPAQIPVDGDDLILAGVGHQLQLNANRTLNSVTFSGSNSFCVPGAGNFTVTATNGWSVPQSLVNPIILQAHGTLGATALTLRGTWTFSGGMGYVFSSSSVAGFVLNVLPASGLSSDYLFRLTGGGTLQFCASWGVAATINLTGVIDAGGAATYAQFLTMTAGMLNWTATGVASAFGVQTFGTFTTAASYSINATFSANCIAFPVISVGGTGTFASVGNITSGGTAASTNAFVSIFRTSATITNPIVHTGQLVVTGNFAIFTSAAGSGLLRLINQTLTVDAAAVFIVNLTNGTSLDLAGTTIQNSGKLAIIAYNTATVTANAGTLIQDMNAAATSVAVGTTALDGKIVHLTSAAPTLPAVGSVAAGVSYGYSGSLQTGTALLVSPETIEASCIAAITDPVTLAVMASANVDVLNGYIGDGNGVFDAQFYERIAYQISGAALSAGQISQLNFIFAAVSQITGSRLETVGSVTPAGNIRLIRGKDYTAAGASLIQRSVRDVGGLLAARLTAPGTTLQFGARIPGPTTQTISGTISGVVYAADVTLISIAIPAANLPETLQVSDGYVYQIQRTISGQKVPEVFGALAVEFEAV